MVAYHLGEDGLPPKPVKRLINDWHGKLRDHDVQFALRDYSTIRPKPGDFLYLDPPYKIEKFRIYLGRFDHGQFFEWLGRQKSPYALSLNGFFGEEDRRVKVPESLFDEELLLDNGTSSMRH